jgi:hypothetical protein
MRRISMLVLLAPLMLLGNNNDADGCADSGSKADARQRQATRTMTEEADRQTGMPAITNFSERKLVKDIYERRDRATSTYAYMQGLDGKLVCLGRAVGYGVPYGAQMTNPQRPMGGWDTTESYQGTTIPQPEPNGLFMPDNADATWIQIVNPETGKVDAVYVEPHLVVSPFRIKGPAVSADCPS